MGLRVVVAGGGTAGHVEPALNLADAVKAMNPDAVVTAIGLDHCEWLGHDEQSIAREKAGIFRAGRPAARCSASRRIIASNRAFMLIGATSSRSKR